MEKDYYKILGLEKRASKDDIKKAYRKLAHQYHPDKQGGDEKKFKEINEAYQVLSDDTKRARYDQFGSAFEQQGGFSGFGGAGFGRGGGAWQGDINDIFREFFGGGHDGFGAGFGGGQTPRQRGSDISIDVELTLEQAFSGIDHTAHLKKFAKCSRCEGRRGEPGTSVKTCSKCDGKGEIRHVQNTILGSFASMQTCPQCGGIGTIAEKPCKQCRGTGREQQVEKITFNIPAGISDGEMVRVSGKGEYDINGAGDLYARIYIKKHPVFIRKESDLYSTITIPMTEAILGGEKSVRVIDGNGKLEIPAGIQSGTLLKLSGKGMSSPQRGGRGNHFFQVIVETPKKVSRRAKELLQGLQKEGL
ncbi:MAG: molecular chaperone DnaJ [Candidatus Spechtbacteria bacterium]|nr:molecular chaperone DnaJ [Candidatus Spechtbacteria bacterium]